MRLRRKIDGALKTRPELEPVVDGIAVNEPANASLEQVQANLQECTRAIIEARLELGGYFDVDRILRSSSLRRCSSLLRLHEVAHQRRHFIGFGVECEVTGVENVNSSVGHIPPIAFWLAEIE
jgi:hypothetical protein